MTSSLEIITLEPPAAADATVIWLHGLGADGNDFVPIVPELGLGDTHGVRFIFPHAPIRPITLNGGMEMRGWYDIAGTNLRRDTDEAGIKQAAVSIASIIEQQINDGITSKRIILAGFSQGGAIAYQLGLRYPKRLAGIIALSTYLPLADQLEAEIEEANRDVPIFIAHGTHDAMVTEEMGRSSADKLLELNLSVDYRTYPMDHAVCLEEIKDIAAFLQQHLR